MRWAGPECVTEGRGQRRGQRVGAGRRGRGGARGRSGAGLGALGGVSSVTDAWLESGEEGGSARAVSGAWPDGGAAWAEWAGLESSIADGAGRGRGRPAGAWPCRGRGRALS